MNNNTLTCYHISMNPQDPLQTSLLALKMPTLPAKSLSFFNVTKVMPQKLIHFSTKADPFLAQKEVRSES